MNFIDYYLDRITMYRLVLYYLIALLGTALIGSLLGYIPYSPISLTESITVLLVVGWVTNTVFAKVFGAPTNFESVYISAFILALVVSPMRSIHDLPLLGWLAVWTMASKFILAINKKHIFNPVAIAAVIVYFALQQAITWWVGNAFMLPVIILGGLLVARKIRHADMIFSFLVVAVGVTLTIDMLRGSNPLASLQHILLHSPILFFAFIMLTEPLTAPPTRDKHALYGGLIGLLFSPQVHIGTFYTTPEIALVVGNAFSYLVSPKYKLLLYLQQKLQITQSEYDFIFPKPAGFAFIPGQYMEWTLSHPNPDSRGSRRYFTLASSPTEDNIRLGIKLYNNSSSYKKALQAMTEKTPIVASQLMGEFTLPKNSQQKCAFIAGGIGITPYRSMIKYLLDTHQSRPIILLYANKTEDEIMYKDVFDLAQQQLGMQSIYTLTDTTAIPLGWNGLIGRIDATMIQTSIPDYNERLFYLSGPHSMVIAYEHVLKGLGIPSTQIIIDFFPGFV